MSIHTHSTEEENCYSHKKSQNLTKTICHCVLTPVYASALGHTGNVLS